MKPQKFVVRSAIFSVAGFVLGVGAAQNVFANPGGATVVHGSAQFATPGANTLEITNSANAIINWQSFGIGRGETTRFIQPSADSAVLNRVTGANVSELLGNLSSNGQVFLINPHGIVVGENAVIDVAGFVASTLNLSDEDFLNGRLDFQGENAGALINRGLVTAGPGGEIVLIAPQIENHGVLSVDNGALLLAAGEKVTLTRFDLNGIEFDVQAPGNRVLNLGELIARRGAVGVFAGSIDQRGIVEAGAIGVDAAGNIVLQAQNAVTVADGARVTASGADGGNIRIQALNGDNIVSGDVEAVGNDGKGVPYKFWASAWD
jgi:filamentous hemagglutinin family protein